MRVMIIGASGNRAKYGNMAVRAYLKRGHEVFAVNPNESSVEGLKTYADPKDVPGPIDRATFYVPPRYGLAALKKLAERGDVAEVFLNPGTESEEILAEGRRLKLNVVQGCAIMDIGEYPH
jgi:predicted CoA-binding protein